MNKKGVSPIAIIAIIAILLIGGISAYTFRDKIPFLSVPNTWGVLPIWGRLECDVLKYNYQSPIKNVPKTGQSFLCGADELTDSCEISFSMPEFGFCNRGQINYKVCTTETTDAGCPPDFESISVSTEGTWVGNVKIMPGERLFVYAQKATICGGAKMESKVKKTYDVWGLNTFIEGAKHTNLGTCVITSNKYRSRTPTEFKDVETLKVNALDAEGQGYVNFVTKWVFGPPTNVYNHPGYGEVYCEGGKIYTIATLKTADGKTYKIRNKEYSDSTGMRYIIPSSPIHDSAVECCPGQVVRGLVCGNDFKWKEGVGECSRDTDCAFNRVCKQSKVLSWQYCENNKCKETTQRVECCQATDCPSPKVCGPAYTCVDQDQNIVRCGDGICSPSESIESCPEDCGACAPGCYPVTKTTKGFWFWQEEETTQDCRCPHKSFIALALIILGMIGIGFVGYKYFTEDEFQPIILYIALAVVLIGIVWWILAGKGII